jgi:sigma-B regulation protein RsbU (phosphoserine phosphatase)
MALENTLLTEAVAREMGRRELMEHELETAREVQQRLFPQSLPDIPRLEYAASCRTARAVGGDYYDFLPLPGGRFALAIADVSGKGVPAALLMASVHASTRAYSQNHDVAAVAAAVNRQLGEASPENCFATFFYAIFDPATRRLTYSNCGHNPPVVLRGDGIIRLGESGPPAGLFTCVSYEQEDVQLESGDLLVLYSDGISEAENKDAEEWGEDQMIETARACSYLTPGEIVAKVMLAADAFAAGAPQHDDMTLVIARVR